MADRVKVTDPYSGVEIEVDVDSPQADLWRESKKAPAKKAASSKKKSED